jgi:phosphoribosylformylglycinamidine cyclo-ligase
VGVVERDEIIDGTGVQPGDRVWGLRSTGLHTNGYSLARQIVAGHDLGRDVDGQLGQSLGDALLAEHPSYVAELTPVRKQVQAIAHITGGGIAGNLPRVLPPAVSVELDPARWPVPPIFAVLQELGGVDDAEMRRVFNMGLGLIFVTRPEVDVAAACPMALEIGRVVPRRAERVVFLHAA